MDSRETLPVKETFKAQLNEAFQSGSKVHLLIDDNGLVRAEGFIKGFFTERENRIIELESGIKVDIKQIVAVNGLFLPEYGEC